jgi:hypothetical protein
MKTEDIEGGRYAAFGLANLAANANHREKIVEDGAVACLVSLSCSEDLNAQRQALNPLLLVNTTLTLCHYIRQALAALRALCISPEYRAVVVREGKDKDAIRLTMT